MSDCEIVCSSWEDYLPTLPDDSVDLIVMSPPYEAARTYGVGFRLSGEEWVKWMVDCFHQCRRVCKGLVACVCQGQTTDYRWSGVPALLLADLIRAGFAARNPPIYHRVGIPGSGGKDWLRSDYEWIICTTRGGRLPWSDNTAMGQPPKFGPGGEMSYRGVDGRRVNACGDNRRANGRYKRIKGPRTVSGDVSHSKDYSVPAIANPGNVIKCNVGGGGAMGDKICHQNEAPFPEFLAEFFVRSFCPPGGVVCDPFSGSGTTAAMALRFGRRFRGCDIRQSQVDLTTRRIANVTPEMFLE